MKTLRALLCLLTLRHKWHGRDLIWSRGEGHATFCTRCGKMSLFVNLHDEDEFDRVHGVSR